MRGRIAVAVLATFAAACEILFPTHERSDVDGGAGLPPGVPPPGEVDGGDGGGPPSCAPCGGRTGGACCSVPGGTFMRDCDHVLAMDCTTTSKNATIPDFRLDATEVSIGRFRMFVDAIASAHPAAGAGAIAGIAGSGWDAAWDASLSTDPTDLQTKLKTQCAGTSTWTLNDDSFAANCMTWFEAFAFCVWDGARLPTEAEWNYAAAGGSEQREYPWAAAQPIDSSRAVFANSQPHPIAVASTHPPGDGKWGSSDLAGNVAEWVLDWKKGDTDYPNPCNANCALLDVLSERRTRGGSFQDDAKGVAATARASRPPTDRQAFVGVRCAR